MFDLLLSHKGLSVERLHALLLLSEHGSLIKAAKGDTGLQSRYSHYMRELSAFFGTSLTRREGRSIKLTASGEELASLVKSQFQAWAEFQNRASNSIPQISIGAGDSLIQWLLVPALGAMRRSGVKQMVKVENLRTNDLVRRLQEQRTDFGLLRSNAIPAGLQSAKVGTIKYVIVVPTRFSLRKPTVETVMKNCPLAAIGGEGELFQHLLSLSKKSRSTFRPDLVCDSISQCLAAVRTGSYAAVLPTQSLENAGAMDCEIVDERELSELERPISIAWNPRHVEAMGVALAQFKTALASALTEEAERRGI